MFDLTWRIHGMHAEERSLDPGRPDEPFSIDGIECVSDTWWKEHCLECAPPECYRQCRHYLQRLDKKCKRTAYGFVPDYSFSGLFRYGVDLRFRTWGKIETVFRPTDRLTVSQARRKARFTNGINRLALRASLLVSCLSPTLKPLGALRHLLARGFRKKKPFGPIDWDVFRMEVYSAESENVTLRLRCDREDSILLVDTIELLPGWNQFELPYGLFNVPRDLDDCLRIFLSPQNDKKPRLVFTWLDFVKYAPSARPSRPAEKVKCVAWDLDNTLWKGVLTEDGPDALEVNQRAIDVIEALDERGIVSTIVSKNSHDDAWAVLESRGLAEWFVYPAINWGRKTENLIQIASAMNIGLDTFALVDDSEHERRDVRRLGCVRVYSDAEIGYLLSRFEFDVPVTTMSRRRRKTYLASMKRDAIRERFGDDFESYLESLDIRISILPVTGEDVRNRCFELLQRSNQLNLSTHRYTRKEYERLLSLPSIRCFAFACSDVVGDLGIVGFVSLELSRKPVLEIKDLVISCRAAQKKIEQSVVCQFAGFAAKTGFSSIIANFRKTERNRPIEMIFESLPFVREPRGESGSLFSSESLDDFRIPFPHAVVWESDESRSADV